MTLSTLSSFKPKRKATRRRRGSEMQFPGKLHDMMEYVERHGMEQTISWTPDGNGIIVHKPEDLLKILPMFFGQTKYRSFQRQLNMWHFERILDGPDKGAFVHPYFVRGNKPLCAYMTRHDFENKVQPSISRSIFTSGALLQEAISASEGNKILMNTLLNKTPSPYSTKQATSSLNNESSRPVELNLNYLKKLGGNDVLATNDRLNDSDFATFAGRSFYLVEDKIEQAIRNICDCKGPNTRPTNEEKALSKHGMLGPLMEPLSPNEIDAIFEDD